MKMQRAQDSTSPAVGAGGCVVAGAGFRQGGACKSRVAFVVLRQGGTNVDGETQVFRVPQKRPLYQKAVCIDDSQRFEEPVRRVGSSVAYVRRRVSACSGSLQRLAKKSGDFLTHTKEVAHSATHTTSTTRNDDSKCSAQAASETGRRLHAHTEAGMRRQVK